MKTSEGLGETVSAFVAERIGGPEIDEEIDFWCEAVYAALFSVTFRLLPYWTGPDDTPEKLAEHVGRLLTEVNETSKKWVEDNLATAGTRMTGQEIEFQISDEIRSRLISYYNTATEAVDERDFSLEAASSHAVFVGLSGWAERQAMRDTSRSPREWADWVGRVVENCISLDAEVQQLIQNKIDEKTGGKRT